MKPGLPVWILGGVAMLWTGARWLRPDPPGRPASAETTAPGPPTAGEVWLRRFTETEPGSAGFDGLLRGIRDAVPSRAARIATLLAAIPSAEIPVRGVLCDMLADEHPAEVAAELRELLRAEKDTDTAGRLLDALCAATMPPEDALPDESLLARAFEQAQAAVDEELARGDLDAERRMAAIGAVVDVFPFDDARERLAAADVTNPDERDFVRGLEWELLVGSASSGGSEALLSHLDEHPELLASEERKAATLEQIEVSELSAAPADEIRPLLVKLRPAPAADGAFARWFELLAVRGQIERGERGVLLETADPLDVASLLHYGGPGWPGELRSRGGLEFERNLRHAAAGTDDPEASDFLFGAADTLANSPE